MSPKTRYKLSNKLAGFLYHYVTLRKSQAEINIIRAFPDWTSQIVNSTLQKTYQFFAHNFIQFIAFPKSWDGLKIDVVGDYAVQSKYFRIANDSINSNL